MASPHDGHSVGFAGNRESQFGHLKNFIVHPPLFLLQVLTGLTEVSTGLTEVSTGLAEVQPILPGADLQAGQWGER